MAGETVDISSGAVKELLEAMNTLIEDYRKDFGKAPKGFVLGPVEFLIFKHAATLAVVVQTSNRHFSYSGITVHVKSSPGVELLVWNADAMRLTFEQAESGTH